MHNSWWQNHFSSKSTSDDIESNRKMLGVSTFCIIGGSTCLLFGLFTPSQDSIILRVALVLCAILLYVNAFSLRYHRRYDLAFNICGYGIIPPALIIVASGGFENTGLYWVYPFLISSFMFLGHLKGLIANVITLLSIYYMCSEPGLIDATYREVEVNRFLASFTVSIFLCFSAEFFRLRSFNRLALISTNQHKLANTDPLTSLPNRRFIDSEFLKAAKNSPEMFFPLAIVLFDLDKFKEVNDAHGHHTGDKVLKHVAQAFKVCIRDADVVSRVGGEEFLVLIPKAELSTAIGIAEKIRERIQRSPFPLEEQKLQLSISAGVTVSTSLDQFTESLKEADALMYQAKRNGRNRVEHIIQSNISKL